jgi:hypothetical protein
VKIPPLCYVKIKREKDSICNICKSPASLSWDHVPPEGSFVVSSVEQETIFQHLVKSKEKKNYLPSQNGVKYRTLCKICNNSLLGKHYDPYLNAFSKNVGTFFKSTLLFPRIIHFKTRPLKIIRALLGHMLAAKAELDSVTFDDVVRDVFLNENYPFPDNVKIYYWIYPYNKIVIVRDIAYHNLKFSEKKAAYLNLIKFFPIAYLITDKPSNYWNGLHELTAYKDLPPDKEIEIPIDFQSFKHPDWPEGDKDAGIAGGRSIQSSIYAKPHVKI